MPAGIFANPAAIATNRRRPDLFIVINFSGGGTRAAALAYGILDKLHRTAIPTGAGDTTTLAAEIGVLSGVSGGSITAAYYAAFRDRLFIDFKAVFLEQDFEKYLISDALDPRNAYRLTSPSFGRGNLLADEFDQRLFHGITYGQLAATRSSPALLISATDLSLGASFPFTAAQFSLICSRLDDVPLAVAVGASNSVPILFSPITLRNYADDCLVENSRYTSGKGGQDRRTARYLAERDSYRDAQLRPYIQLVDGALSDNLGVRLIIDNVTQAGGFASAFAGSDAHNIGKVVLINVNAGNRRSFEVDRSDRVPSTLEVAQALRFGLLSRHTEETSEMYAAAAATWREDVHRLAVTGRGPFAPGADLYYIEIGLASLPDQARRERLLDVPTAYVLDKSQVADLIAAGSDLLEANTEFRRLLEDIARQSAQPLH